MIKSSRLKSCLNKLQLKEPNKLKNIRYQLQNITHFYNIKEDILFQNSKLHLKKN
jgi:hypothetical protein